MTPRLRPALILVALALPVAGLGCARTSQTAAEPPAEVATPNPTAAPPVSAPVNSPPVAAGTAPGGNPSAVAGTSPPAAQGTPVPVALPPPGKPVAPPATGMKLAYRYQQGTTHNYRVGLKMDQTIQMEGGGQPGAPAGAGSPQMSVSVNISADLQMGHAIKALAPGGAADVLTRVNDGEVRFNSPMAGGEQVVHVKNGQVTMGDGEPQPGSQGQQGTQQAQMLLQGLLGGEKEMRVASTGKVVSGQAAASGSMQTLGQGTGLISQGTGGYGLLVLPSRPVKPGDTWTDIQTVPGAAGKNGAKGKPTTITTHYTFKELRERDGHKIAVIEQTSSVAMPPGGAGPMGMQVQRMKQEMHGTTEFDIDAGEVASGNYTLTTDSATTMSMQVPQQPGAPGGPGGSTTMTRKMMQKGSGTMQVVRQPAS